MSLWPMREVRDICDTAVYVTQAKLVYWETIADTKMYTYNIVEQSSHYVKTAEASKHTHNRT